MSIVTMPELSHDEAVRPDFEEIFREYASMIYRTARAVTGNAEDAEDIVQTVFLRIMRSEYSGQLRKNPKAYLYRAAVNLSLDVLRARTRRAFTHEVDRLETPAATGNASFDDELHQRLGDALAKLDPEAAHILVLRYVHDYSDAEISKLLGTSRSAIAVRLFRLRARLKKTLGRLGEGHERR
jgi:RNA polymerase sigma-70 factor (ECF subfamily)